MGILSGRGYRIADAPGNHRCIHGSKLGGNDQKTTALRAKFVSNICQGGVAFAALLKRRSELAFAVRTTKPAWVGVFSSSRAGYDPHTKGCAGFACVSF